MNDKNLRSFAELCPAERKEIARKAGVASGIARRERRKLRDELNILLSSGDVQERMCVAMVDAAMSGDVNAFKAIRDTAGEKPVDNTKIELSGTTSDLEAFIDDISTLYKNEMKRTLSGKEKKYGELSDYLISMLSIETKERIILEALNSE